MRLRRSARGLATASLSDLPSFLSLRILALLPADQRLRCAELSRGWRALVAEPSLWQALDLSPAAGIHAASAALLRAAAARARGGLTRLDVSGCLIPIDVLCEVLRANAGVTELRRLVDIDKICQSYLSLWTTGPLLSPAELLQLRQAAPALQALHADVGCPGDQAATLLASEPGPLRLRALRLETFLPNLLLPLRRLLGDATVHPSLRELVLASAGNISPDTLDIVADAAVERRLASLRLSHNILHQGCVATLARIVERGALSQLVIDSCRSVLLADEVELQALAGALRGNTTLTSLTLRGFDMVDMESRPAVAAALLDSLHAHSSLRALDISANSGEHGLGGAVIPALARLVAANAPALTSLDVSNCKLLDAGLGPLVAALASNTHLRELRMSGNEMSAAFARNRLLPAVRGNAGLRVLVTDKSHTVAVREALALIARR